MRLHLKIWRQAGPNAAGRLVDYPAEHVSPDMSFLAMLDVVNEGLIAKGEDPIAFDSDCREGICGACGVMIDGVAHGPDPGTTTCQLHKRRFKDGDTLTICLSDKGSTDRPTNFESPEGTNIMLITLKRIKK